MLKKRGLSPVVANVLIILLVIAAVAIVWAVVRPAIENTGEQITTGTECISLDFEVVSCNAAADEVTVRRNVGGTPGPVDYVITAPSGNVNSATGLDELGTSGAVTVTVAAGDEVNVAARLASGNLCNPVRGPVTC